MPWISPFRLKRLHVRADIVQPFRDGALTLECIQDQLSSMSSSLDRIDHTLRLAVGGLGLDRMICPDCGKKLEKVVEDWPVWFCEECRDNQILKRETERIRVHDDMSSRCPETHCDICGADGVRVVWHLNKRWCRRCYVEEEDQ